MNRIIFTYLLIGILPSLLYNPANSLYRTLRLTNELSLDQPTNNLSRDELMSHEQEISKALSAQ